MRSIFLVILLLGVFTFSLKAQPEAQTIFKCFDADMPQFPGGAKALNAFLVQNIHYPEKARSDNIEGRVLMKMIIRKNGKIDSAGIMKSVRSDVDSEALRVVKRMPRWTPVKDKRNRKDVWYYLPINFKLE